MLLYVVRHAQSEANAQVPGASEDCRLTDLGRRQARAVAARLAEIGLDRVLASPYTRTLETAEEIRTATGAPAAIVPLLHEHYAQALPSDRIDDWPLMSRAALAARFPHFELPPDFAFDPKWHEIPETDDAVVRRGKRVLEDLWRRYAASEDGRQDVRLVLVTHGSPAGKLLMGALGIESPRGIDVQIDNASISIVAYAPDRKVLVASNRIDHLTHL
jgi:broad specificity phosphatase PhoE